MSLKDMFAGKSVVDKSSLVRQAVRLIVEEALERLAVETYARGLAVRDIEAAFTDETGRCVLTRSAVSQVSERLWADYQAFAGRDLSLFTLLQVSAANQVPKARPPN